MSMLLVCVWSSVSFWEIHCSKGNGSDDTFFKKLPRSRSVSVKFKLREIF